MKNLKELTLRNNRLKKIELRKLVNLDKLDLSDNNLISIPELDSLKNLTELIIADNSIEEIQRENEKSQNA